MDSYHITKEMGLVEMVDFFAQNSEYTLAKANELDSARPCVASVKNIRQDYKVLTGRAMRYYFDFNSLGGLIDQQVISCWSRMSQDSVLFRDSMGMIECILLEVISNNVPKVTLDLKKRMPESKTEFNEIIRIARKEARNVQNLYRRVAELDCNYSDSREYAKIRKALLFIKTAVHVCFFSRLPTKLSEDEYNELVRLSGRPDVVAARFRPNQATGEYMRIGAMPRKSAYKLFGIEGCTVLVRKSIRRYETMLEALRH